MLTISGRKEPQERRESGSPQRVVQVITAAVDCPITGEPLTLSGWFVGARQGVTASCGI